MVCSFEIIDSFTHEFFLLIQFFDIVTLKSIFKLLIRPGGSSFDHIFDVFGSSSNHNKRLFAELIIIMAKSLIGVL